MERKLNPEQLRIYKAIDEILWEAWDPISMKQHEGPRDEYEDKMTVIFSLKSVLLILKRLLQNCTRSNLKQWEWTEATKIVSGSLKRFSTCSFYNGLIS